MQVSSFVSGCNAAVSDGDAAHAVPVVGRAAVAVVAGGGVRDHDGTAPAQVRGLRIEAYITCFYTNLVFTWKVFNCSQSVVQRPALCLDLLYRLY